MKRLLLPLLLLSVGLAGCGGASKIVGAWQLEGADQGAAGLEDSQVLLTFNKDDSLQLKLTSKGPAPGGEGEFTLTVLMQGTYAYDKEKESLDLTLTDVSIETSGLEEEQKQAITQSLDKQKTLLLDEANEKNQFKDVAWDGDDKMTMKNTEGTEIVLRRSE